MSGVTPPPGWRAMTAPGLMASIGPLLAQRDGDRWRYALATDESHANPIGLVHGGALTALVDHAMSMIAWEATSRRPVVTVQMSTQFLSAAKPGEFLEADAMLRRLTGSMVFIDAMIRVGEREILAASSVMKIVKQN